MQRARCSESAPRHVRLTAATRPMDRPSSDFALARILAAGLHAGARRRSPAQHAGLLAPGARGRARARRLRRGRSGRRHSFETARSIRERVDRLSIEHAQAEFFSLQGHFLGVASKVGQLHK